MIEIVLAISLSLAAPVVLLFLIIWTLQGLRRWTHARQERRSARAELAVAVSTIRARQSGEYVLPAVTKLPGGRGISPDFPSTTGCPPQQTQQIRTAPSGRIERGQRLPRHAAA